MEILSGYKLVQIIEKTDKTTLYRAQKTGQNKTLIIKELNTSYPTASEIARFRQEFELIRKLDFPGIVKNTGIEEKDNIFYLMQEDFQGVSLAEFLKTGLPDIPRFLDISLQLSEILNLIHRHYTFHKSLKPQNIIIEKKTQKIKIANFNIEYILTHENEEIYNPFVIKEILPYISPEQTGRMNRSVDYRTDLYSLGITLYEMLTGKPPFQSSDPLEIIHSHIAKEPVPPSQINPKIPEIISEIIMKLLSKSAEDRYQNSFGLAADLGTCLIQLKKKGHIEKFELAKKDISLKFNIPQGIFGRESEISLLMAAFERISGGKSEMMLVTGQPGIGKSLIINEVHKPIVKKRGYFISGKYDLFRKDVPYSAIIQAFQNLVRQILSESVEKINEWKNKLLKELGNNGRIITEVISEVEYIIGPQKELPPLSPEQSQNRFNIVFKSFTHVFATREHPLVLFFDDIHWADNASLSLMKSIITDPDIQYLLIIGSYRESEMNPFHPLLKTIEDLKKNNVSVSHIQIPPLDISHVNQLIANFLRVSEEFALDLARLVHKKTNGNPFFVNQFLRTLHDEKLIELSPARGWTWDLDKIEKLRVTDNVVEMMADKINRLPGQTQELIKICACIGNRFDLETLSIIFGKGIDEILNILSVAVNEGLIYLHDNMYRFYHDRIQEAAYSLIKSDEKKKMHYQIGKLTLQNTKEKEMKDKILYIVDQLNAGRSLIQTGNEIFELAQLNYKAGNKAKISAAYVSALNYFKTGIELLGESGWNNRYQLMLSLHTEAVESAYLSTNYEQIELLSEKAFKHTGLPLDEVRIYEAKINMQIALNKLFDAMKTGRHILRSLGVSFPVKPNLFLILTGLIKTSLVLNDKKIGKIIDLPMMTDSKILAITGILACLTTAAYISLKNFLPLIVFKMIFYSIRYGHSFISPFVYAAYGLILCSTGRIEKGYQFGKLALDLIGIIKQEEYQVKTVFAVNCFIRHWKEHVNATIEPLTANYQKGLEIGDIEFAAHSLGVYCEHIFYTGKNLEWIHSEMERVISIITKLKQEALIIWLQFFKQVVLNLIEPSERPYILSGKNFDEEKILSIAMKAGDRNIIMLIYAHKLILMTVFREFSLGLDYADIAEKYVDALTGQANYYYFYDSLIRLGALGTVKGLNKKSLMKKILKNQKILKKWSRTAPMNYLHKYCLVEAEIANLKGNDLKAMAYYDKAVKGARENEYVNDEAVSCELAAMYYLKKKRNNIAALYLTDAYNAYNRWGAAVKSRMLEDKYPDLITSFRKGKRSRKSDINKNLNEAVLETLDLSTIIKTSKALSSEIELAPLLEKIMKFSFENAGAQKGFLILYNEKDKKFYIEAEGEIDKSIRVLRPMPVESSGNLPLSIINFVTQTMENVVLEDSCHKGPFIDDPYIANNHIKSVLCAPIIEKGSIIGIIYLENNLLGGAFTPERLELLRILSSQAAISINNTRLVERERESAALQKEIEMAQKIQNSLLPANIPDVKNMEIAFKYVPMTGIGGDFISVLYDESTQILGLFICDVSGHGVPAALTASMISMALDFSWKRHIDHPSMVLKEMKENLKEKMGGNYFTASICVLNLADGALVNASAGHPPVLIIRNNKNIEFIQTRGGLISDFIELNVHETTVKLKKEDMIVLYTDGITEAENPHREQLGADDEKFKEWIKTIALKSGTPALFCQDIYKSVISYAEKDNLYDDFTLLAVKYNR